MIGFWIINAIMAILSILCFGYQFYYLLISLLKPAKRFPEGERQSVCRFNRRQKRRKRDRQSDRQHQVPDLFSRFNRCLCGSR